jgi:hypothetical protein
MARFKAPKNFGGFTHQGETYKAKKGVVELPDEIPNHLAASHGLLPDDAPEEQQSEDPPAGGEGSGE